MGSSLREQPSLVWCFCYRRQSCVKTQAGTSTVEIDKRYMCWLDQCEVGRPERLIRWTGKVGLGPSSKTI